MLEGSVNLFYITRVPKVKICVKENFLVFFMAVLSQSIKNSDNVRATGWLYTMGKSLLVLKEVFLV